MFIFFNCLFITQSLLHRHTISSHSIRIHRNLISYNKLAYFIHVQVGSKLQGFDIQVDTGSTVMWIQNLTCEGCNYNNRFQGSDTLLQLDIMYSQKYGVGFAEGPMCQDQVRLENLFVNYTFALLNKSSDFNLQGIFGLSNIPEYSNIFEIAYNAGQIKSSLFGLSLKKGSEQLLYGDFDVSHVRWVPASYRYRWQVHVYGFYIDEFDITDAFQGESQNALLDSGSSCMGLPGKVIDYINNHVFNKICLKSGTQSLCPLSSKLYPKFYIYLEGVRLSIEYKDYMILNGNFYISCLYQRDNVFAIFGDPIFQRNTFIFDKINNRIGINAHTLEEIHLIIYMIISNAILLILIVHYLYLCYKT